MLDWSGWSKPWTLPNCAQYKPQSKSAIGMIWTRLGTLRAQGMLWSLRDPRSQFNTEAVGKMIEQCMKLPIDEWNEWGRQFEYSSENWMRHCGR
jgi:hypothetical protein